MDNTTNTVRRERRRPQISCTECRRRKQKCNKRKDEPCTNCMRRYPPVECYVQEIDDSKATKKRKGQDKLDDKESPTFFKAASRNSGYQEQQPSRFPPIPLSRILHPAHNTLRYVLKREKVSTLIAATPTQIGFILGEDPNDDGLTSSQQKSKLRNSSFQEVVDRQKLNKEGPRTIGGTISILNSFNEMPVKTSLRNTELFHFFHNYVQPRLCSLDGGNIPEVFLREILPWQMQSPLMPNVSILMAAATQSNLRQSDIRSDPETLVIKAHVLGLVNQFIQKDFWVVANQAMRIVIHLVVIEFFWGNAESMWPHMEGIKQMLDLNGGLYNMNDPLNMHVLIVTDYELACAFERNLTFQSPEAALATELPLIESYPEKYRSPLIHYPAPYRESIDVLPLTIAGAEILDDVRFLTVSITSCLLPNDSDPIKTSKIQSTAEWLYKQVKSLPELQIEENASCLDLIFDTIRITALAYSSAIKDLTPMSLTFPAPLKERLYQNITCVGYENWKEIPGIFLWILLVATPSGKEDFRGRFLRKQMACAGMNLGLEDFFRGTALLRAFWVVQRWIEAERAKAENCKLDI